MKKYIVAGNWKMNLTLDEAIDLANEVSEKVETLQPEVQVMLFPPYIHLVTLHAIVNPQYVTIGAQDCSSHTDGAYTGEVSAQMIRSTSAGHVIIGHSERRQYFQETPQQLNEKVQRALEQGLDIIFCVGEPLDIRNKNEQNDFVSNQLNALFQSLQADDMQHITIAYEPIWAIGTGQTATPQQAQEMHFHIRETIREHFGDAIADQTTLLYGGSCKPDNAEQIFSQPDIDGGLIGGASLEAASFVRIAEALQQAKASGRLGN